MTLDDQLPDLLRAEADAYEPGDGNPGIERRVRARRRNRTIRRVATPLVAVGVALAVAVPLLAVPAAHRATSVTDPVTDPTTTSTSTVAPPVTVPVPTTTIPAPTTSAPTVSVPTTFPVTTTLSPVTTTTNPPPPPPPTWKTVGNLGGRVLQAGPQLQPWSCTSDGFCLVVGFTQISTTSPTGVEVWTTADPTGSGPWEATPLPARADTATCASRSLCIAANAEIMASTSPATGPWIPVDTNDGGGYFGLSCPSVDLCLALDRNGEVVTSRTPAVAGSWTAVTLPLGGRDFTGDSGVFSASCANSHFCVIGASKGEVLVSTDPTGTAAAWTVDVAVTDPRTESPVSNLVDYYDQILGVSCPSVSFCAAVDAGGTVLTATSATQGLWTSEVVAAGAPLQFENYISCASANRCTVDTGGHLFDSLGPGFGVSGWTEVEANAFDFVPVCPTPQLCLALAPSNATWAGSAG